MKADSIQIIIGDTGYYFHQKKRCEPKEYKNIVFYKKRYLINNYITIKTLKLLDINKNNITAEALIRYNTPRKTIKKKEVILLPLNDIEGVFLGSGKKERSILLGLGILGGLAGTILLLSQ